MKPTPRRLLAATLAATAATLATPDARGVTVARVTRHGYILTDDPGQPEWNDTIPIANSRDMYTFISEATNALENVDGFHEGQYLATMQIPSGMGNAVAFYLPIRNDVRGIGQQSPIDSHVEVFDLNRTIGTGFSLNGFLWLNTVRFYTDPRTVNYGRYLLCTQEFGHRFGATSRIGAFPTGVDDAGVPGDAGADAGIADASDPDAATDGAVLADGAAGDAPPVDAGPAPLARDALLGRGNTTMTGMVVNRAHWSYFLNSGGSPMEGNLWTETSPGHFRTEQPSFRFSDLDLYNMGLIPASAVRPTFLIDAPAGAPRNVTRDSPPEFNGRQVTLTGRRVDVAMGDILAANGARSPAYPDTPRDMDVVWVLWATPDAVTDDLVAEFDQAIESCSLGYTTAAQNLSRLVAMTPYVEPADAGFPDAGTPDAGTADAPSADVVTADASATDAPSDARADAAPAATPGAAGGCACRTSPRGAPRTPGAVAGLALAAMFVRRRRRRAMLASRT